jgi:hypothetical protein
MFFHLESGVMSHARDSHWILPGSSSFYRIVWWYDAAAKDSSSHAPLFEVLSHLRTWVRSHELILRRIDEALGEQPRENLSRLEAGRGREQIEQRLGQAFRKGRLVAIPSNPGNAVSPSAKNPVAAAKRKDMNVLVGGEKGTAVPGARLSTSNEASGLEKNVKKAGFKSNRPQGDTPGAEVSGVVRVDDFTPSNVGEKLDEFVAKMKQLSKDDVARGGSIKITAPAVTSRDGNRVSLAPSVEFFFGPDDLYVREMRVGDKLVKIAEKGENYPPGPRIILREYEIDALIRDFYAYVQRDDPRNFYLKSPPRQLAKLPNLIAMLAEGTRFPDLRNHIKAKVREPAEDGVKNVLAKAVEQVERERPVGDIDASRVLPSYYINNWEQRYKEGMADFRRSHWSQRGS